MIKLAQILLTIAAIQYGLIPPIVDLSDSHLFHEAWPPHARLHMAWLLAVGSSLAIYVIFLTWKPSPHQLVQLKHGSVIGCLVLMGFFVSAMSMSLYGGSLSDIDEPNILFGLNANVLAFSIAALFQITATFIVHGVVKK